MRRPIRPGPKALLSLISLLALPNGALADPDIATLRARRHALLGHALPMGQPVDGQARPRLRSAFDFERVIVELAPTAGRILPAEGRIDIELQVVDAGAQTVPIFAFTFAPLEIRLGGQALDFMHVPETAELLVFLPEPQPVGALRLEMQVAFADGYCGDPTGCIERGQQHHLAQIGWYPLNGESGPDDPFQVELDLVIDDGRVAGATGSRAEPQIDGRRVRWHFETTQATILPAFALGPNVIVDAGGPIEIYVPPGGEAGGVVGESAQAAVGLYAQLFGPYPYERLGITPIADAASVGLGPQANILLPESFWFVPRDRPEAEIVAQVTAHEVGHQYFFNLVNIVDAGEGWMSEAFAEYAATRFSEARTNTRDHFRLNYWDYLLGVDRRQDAAINSEQVDLRPPDVRQRIIYYKGSALLNQLRDRFEGFDAHMRAYVEAFAGEITTTRDFTRFMRERLGPLAGTFIEQWTGRPGYPTLQIKVNHPRDGADEMSVFVVQIDDTGFGGTIPIVGHYEDGGTQPIEIGIDRGIPETLDLGRAQHFVLDPDLAIFRRAFAEPAGDVNLSGVVDGMDLLDVLASEGMSVPDPRWDDVLDADRDLQISVGDRRVVLSQWGAGW